MRADSKRVSTKGREIMREKFARFMAGRYGMDTMGRFTIGLALFLVVINYIFTSRIINLLVWILLILAYYRMFSRNVYKRDSPKSGVLGTRHIRSVTGSTPRKSCLVKKRGGPSYHSVHPANRRSVYQEARAGLIAAVQSVTPHLSKRAKESSHVRIHCN